MKIIRTEVVRFEDGGAVWSIETVRGDHTSFVVITELPQDWRPGADSGGLVSITIPFGHARALAVGLLRAVYHEMPATWHLAEGDPEEYLAHVLELIYDMTPKREANPRDGVRNLLIIEKHIRRLTRLVGIARRRTHLIKKRYLHAAGWARRNHKRVVEQRKQLAKLNRKDVSDGEIQKKASSN